MSTTPDCGWCQMFPRGPEAAVTSQCADILGVNVRITVTALCVVKAAAAHLCTLLLMLASAGRVIQFSPRNIKLLK